MTPTHSAERDGRGGAERLEHDPVEEGREQRQEAPAVEVAAGLRAGQLPDGQDALLACGGQTAADRPAQLRSVGDEVEREEEHGQELQQRAEGRDGQPHGLVLLIVDEPLDGAVGVVEVVDHLLGVEVRPERVVDRVDGVGDVRLGVLEQVGDLRADERPDRADEHEEHRQHPEEDQRRRAPSPPPPLGQPVHAGLDGQCEEHRDGQQHDEPAQLAPEEREGHRREKPAPEDDDGRDDPAREAPVHRRSGEVVSGRGRRNEVRGGLVLVRHPRSVPRAWCRGAPRRSV